MNQAPAYLILITIRSLDPCLDPEHSFDLSFHASNDPRLT